MALFLCGGALSSTACKKALPDPCDPEKKANKVFRLVVQPELMNLDNEGNPRTTIVRVYQLKGGRTLDVMDFDTVFETPEEFFGDELLTVKELPVYNGRPEVIEIEAAPEATHAVAVALFREPTGNTWYREWEVPQFHGHSVCQVEDYNAANAAKKKKKQTEPRPPVPDPCFYLSIEGTELDGGHTAPPAYDPELFEGLLCPGKPLKVKPIANTGGKKKKKKKRDLKGDAEKAQEGGAKAQGGADKAQGGADAAQGGADKAGSAGEKVGGGK